MLILRIKRAEVALADGRLDEAYKQAIREDVQQHRRGQKLVDRLTKRLIEQGQLHAAQDQPEQALFDYERAARIGGNQPQLAKLRGEAMEVLNARHQQKRRRDHLVRVARRQIQRGDLSVGAKMVDQMEFTDTAAEELVEDIQVRRASVEATLERAVKSIQRQGYEDAIGSLQELKRLQPGNQRLVELTEQVTRELLSRAREAIDGGRLDQATLLLRQLTLLAEEHLEVAELKRIVQQCHAAASLLRRGDIQKGHQQLTRIAQLLPEANWLRQSILRAEQAATALGEIQAGPLGLLDSVSGSEAPANGRAVGRDMASQPTLRWANPLESAGDNLPMRFLLQVDGSGSFVVARNSVTTIGPASSSRRPDISLLAPSNLPTVRIERLDGDYFLRSAAPVLVNKKTVTEKLLNDGDRITLGPRCEFRFLLPNAASTTAVLELSGARLPRQDIRRVVLLDESIVLGASRTTHITVSDQPQNVVLHLRGEQLRYRPNSAARLHGVDDNSVAIPTGKSVQVGEVSIVVTELTDSKTV